MQAKGPFWCLQCSRMLEWRQIKDGRCQGHLLTEYRQSQPAASTQALVDVVDKHLMDRKYGRWLTKLWRGYGD